MIRESAAPQEPSTPWVRLMRPSESGLVPIHVAPPVTSGASDLCVVGVESGDCADLAPAARPFEPASSSIDVSVNCLFSADLAPQVAACSLRCEDLAVVAQSYSFALPHQLPPEQAPSLKVKSRFPSLSHPCTRIRPPSDVVRIEDRLLYVLQPPLEQLICLERLSVPSAPFPYQLHGVAFLYPRHGAVLADEMGLGKTIQAITAIRLLMRAGDVRRCLLVCPKPLIANWQREFAVWAPEIPVIPLSGEAPRRAWQWQQQTAAVKLANYELLVRDRDLLGDHGEFDLVVLDEAQRIKNPQSTTHQVVTQLRRKRSWALTGTPIENRVEDLIGIFQFVAPGLLRPEQSIASISQNAQDLILRRTKDMVLRELPPKLFRDAELELTAPQAETYREAEEAGVIRLNQLGESLTIQHVFELVLRLKQVCNFDPVTGSSAKVERLLADLEEVVTSGHKAIIFSQWVDTIRRLTPLLESYGPLEYHGRISHAQRARTLEQFRDDPSCRILLMSYGAGSVGLNLQFCQYVFLFDRWWNPAVEDQAINRAHRIGVAGPVTVTRMLIRDTIEQRIDDILQQKRELFETVLSGTARPPRELGLSQEEIFGLFHLRGSSLGKPSSDRREAA